MNENLNTSGSFLSKHYKTILLAVFGLFVLYWMIFVITPSVTMSNEEKQKIDQQISSLLEENQKHVIVRDSGYGLDPNWKEEWGFVNGL